MGHLELFKAILCGYFWSCERLSGFQHPLLSRRGLHSIDGFCVCACLFLLQTDAFQKPVPLEQHPDYAEYILHTPWTFVPWKRLASITGHGRGSTGAETAEAPPVPCPGSS